MSEIRDAAMTSKAWPFEEARRVLKRYAKAPPEKGYVLFSTGYGPSGLPHIGTFGEVARTTMIQRAFEVGFLIFLPFLVIDLVVASVLLSMGMFMLPPAMVSTPIKVLIFVLVDGWRLVTESVVTSFTLTGGA